MPWASLKSYVTHEPLLACIVWLRTDAIATLPFLTRSRSRRRVRTTSGKTNPRVTNTSHQPKPVGTLKSRSRPRLRPLLIESCTKHHGKAARDHNRNAEIHDAAKRWTSRPWTLCSLHKQIAIAGRPGAVVHRWRTHRTRNPHVRIKGFIDC